MLIHNNVRSFPTAKHLRTQHNTATATTTSLKHKYKAEQNKNRIESNRTEQSARADKHQKSFNTTQYNTTTNATQREFPPKNVTETTYNNISQFENALIGLPTLCKYVMCFAS